MTILNIVDKIYESKNFKMILLVSIILLIVLFLVVLILGLKDAKRTKNPKRKIDEDLKDITFELPTEDDKMEINEDVTFEMTALTENLENFKKSLEEEIEKEDAAIDVKNHSEEGKKEPKKILDKDEIENTQINLNRKDIEVLDESDLKK